MESNYGCIRVMVCNDIPENEVWAVDGYGRVISKIINIGHEKANRSKQNKDKKTDSTSNQSPQRQKEVLTED